MALIKQIIYNIEDYHNNGGLISTSKNNHENIISSVNKDYNIYINERIDIYSDNILESIDGKCDCIKLGIQAPPGTHVLIDNKDIMIGRTGTFELDEGITIHSLKFIQPKHYILDEIKTNNIFQRSQKQFHYLETERYEELSKLKDDQNSKIEDKLISYTKKTFDYYSSYLNPCYEDYLQGINGVYILPSEIKDSHRILDKQNPYSPFDSEGKIRPNIKSISIGEKSFLEDNNIYNENNKSFYYNCYSNQVNKYEELSFYWNEDDFSINKNYNDLKNIVIDYILEEKEDEE